MYLKETLYPVVWHLQVSLILNYLVTLPACLWQPLFGKYIFLLDAENSDWITLRESLLNMILVGDKYSSLFSSIYPNICLSNPCFMGVDLYTTKICL